MDDSVDSTVRIIEDAELPHPYPALLSSFVTEALDPRFAARYIRERRLVEGWEAIVADWTYIIDCVTQSENVPSHIDAETRREIRRRDGERCCITGKRGVPWDPLVVRPIFQAPIGWNTGTAHTHDMLGAFFSPPYRDWWLSVVEFPASVMAAQSHWLVRSSAAKEFNKGYVKLNRLQPSTTEYEVSHVLLGPETPISVYGRFPLLGDHSRSGIMKVDPRFIGTQARLCRSVRLLRLARTASFMRSSRTPSSTSVRTTALSGTGQYSARRVHDSMSSRFFVLLFSLWRFVPSSIRITSYKLLQSLGTFLYGCSNEYTIVQRLPFGLYLKSQSEPDAARNEFNALQLVRKYTSIPAPQALDLVIKPAPRHDAFASPETYLIMTRLPGHPLSQCQEVLSDADCEQVIAQLREYTAEIRNIPKKVNSEMAICNSLGEACRDPRVRGGDAVGPFSDESAFSQTLRYSDDPSRRGHEIVYTHADLNPRNILVDKFRGPDGSWSWRVTGIVDWESSGYYPEYWEYTKAMFEGFRWTRRYNKLVTAVFERYGDYCRELEIERRSWESGDGI